MENEVKDDKNGNSYSMLEVSEIQQVACKTCPWKPTIEEKRKLDCRTNQYVARKKPAKRNQIQKYYIAFIIWSLEVDSQYND